MFMPDEFIPSIESPEPPSSDAWWFIYSGYRLLVKISEATAANPTTKDIETLGVEIRHRIYLGTFRGLPCQES
jgi:hypothetical protein